MAALRDGNAVCPSASAWAQSCDRSRSADISRAFAAQCLCCWPAWQPAWKSNCLVDHGAPAIHAVLLVFLKLHSFLRHCLAPEGFWAVPVCWDHCRRCPLLRVWGVGGGGGYCDLTRVLAVAHWRVSLFLKYNSMHFMIQGSTGLSPAPHPHTLPHHVLPQVVALANLLPEDSNVDELDSYMYQTVRSGCGRRGGKRGKDKRGGEAGGVYRAGCWMCGRKSQSLWADIASGCGTPIVD